MARDSVRHLRVKDFSFFYLKRRTTHRGKEVWLERIRARRRPRYSLRKNLDNQLDRRIKVEAKPTKATTIKQSLSSLPVRLLVFDDPSLHCPRHGLMELSC